MKTLTALFNLVRSFTLSGGIVPSIFLVTTTLIAVFTWMQQQWALLVTKLAVMTAISTDAINFSGVGLINTFFPLTECLSFLTAYLGLLGVAAVIRIVKSFIPSIAS